MRVFVVVADSITDFEGLLMESEVVMGCFTTREAAADYINTIEEGYMRKHDDYSIYEEEIQ